MKNISISLVVLGLLMFAGCASSGPRKATAGCATCIFNMKDVTGCKLAVKIDGAPYLVTGSDIDDHGNAHATDGLCNSARNAIIEGAIQEDQFAATKIEILDE